MTVELYPKKGTSLFGLSTFFACFCTVVVTLRFLSRSTLSGKRYGPDDWVCLAAWPMIVALLSLCDAMMRSGFGLPVDEISPANLTLCLKLLWAAFIAYNLAISLVRISVFLFYRRVFENCNRYMKFNFWAGIIASTCWFIAFLMTIVFVCSPVYAFWDRSVPGYTCLGTFSTQAGSAITSAVLDLWILVTPVPLLWRLHIPLRRKLGIISIFIVGYCVIVFTVGRVASVFITGDTLNSDPTWGFVTTFYWFVCEITCAFVASCLPSLVHLGRRGREHGVGALFSVSNRPQNFSRLGKNSKTGTNGHDEFSTLNTQPLGVFFPHSASSASGGLGADLSTSPIKHDLEMGAIRKKVLLSVEKDKSTSEDNFF